MSSSKPDRLSFFSLSLALLLSGCLEIPSTQVMAIILAEEEIAEEIADVVLEIYGSSEGTSPERVASLQFTREDFPASVALVPRDPKETDRQFGLEAIARDGEERTRAIVRARGRYVMDEARTAYLRFDNECLDILHCSPDETCSLGRCIDALLDEEEYGELGDGRELPLPPIARPDQALVRVGETATLSPLENDQDPAGLALRLVAIEPWERLPETASLELIEGEKLTVNFAEYPGEHVRLVYTVRNERGARARGLIELQVIDRDSDGDGIPDNIERASGCLDYLNPDTDGDGIPDGVEDANQNGKVDPDETDPCRASSDGTGVCDGPPRAVLPAGCDDFAVRFIDPSRPDGGETDGRSWQTAFRSLTEAIDAEEDGWIPPSRHYWIREGELTISPFLYLGGPFQRLYGGFRGNEPSAAHREPHRYTKLSPQYIEPEASLIVAAEAQSGVIDGFAFQGIEPADPSVRELSSLISVVASQSIRLSRLYLSEVAADALIRASHSDDLTLSELIIYRSRAVDESTGLISLTDVQGRLEGSLFVNNPGEERLTIEPLTAPMPIAPAVSIRNSAGSLARHFEIRRSSFYANKSTASDGSLIYAESPYDGGASSLKLVDIRMMLPAYAASPSSAVAAEGLSALELLNVAIYDRSARSDDPAGFQGATDQTVRAYDVGDISLRHVTNDAEYIGPWNRLLFVSSAQSERATTVRFEDNVSTLATPIFDRDGLLDEIDVVSRRYCETAEYELSAGLLPIARGCSGESGATGDALVQGLDLPLSELSSIPGGRSPAPPVAPGFYTRRAGPYLNSVTRGEASAPACAPSLRWSANARGCLLLESGAPFPARLSSQGERSAIDFLDVLACFGDGPPVANLPALEHDCHPVR